MLSTLLDIVQGQGDKAGNFYFDNFGEALVYALIGFLVVVVGIVIIIGVIWLVGFIMRKTNGLEFVGKKKVKEKPVEVVEEKAVSQDDEIPDEVKAAIIAAIMAYYQGEQNKCSFTVKRIKRI